MAQALQVIAEVMECAQGTFISLENGAEDKGGAPSRRWCHGLKSHTSYILCTIANQLVQAVKITLLGQMLSLSFGLTGKECHHHLIISSWVPWGKHGPHTYNL